MKAKEYRDAVNSGKMKAPKVPANMKWLAKTATVWGVTTAKEYKDFVNGGAK